MSERVKKSWLNAKVNTVCYFISLFVAFFSRKIFIDHLGADFIGLTGTLQSLLGFLNLAELGVGTAVAYTLYKPLFEKDRDKINEILSVMGYLYRRIGQVICVGAAVLACFMPLIFPPSQLVPAQGVSYGTIYCAFAAFLTGSLIGYFVNYRMVLLSADQRNYVVTGYIQIMTTIKVLIQMALIVYVHSYYLWIAVELLFGVLNALILNYKLDKTYPWLRCSIRSGKDLTRQYPEITRKVKQVFFHKIGSFAQFQSMPFLIYAFVSLPVVTAYGNYILITSKVDTMIGNVLNSTGAGVGSLIAEGNKDHILKIYWELFSVRIFVMSVIVFAVYMLINPFIAIWLGAEYLLSGTALLLIVIYQAMGLLRGTTDQFINGYGMFQDTWAPVTEALIFVVVAIVGGILWGLEGVLLGGVVSIVAIVGIWKPYFLFSKGMHRPVITYWGGLLRHLLPVFVAACITMYILHTINLADQAASGYLGWIYYASVLVTVYSLISIILFYATSKGFRSVAWRILKAVKSR